MLNNGLVAMPDYILAYPLLKQQKPLVNNGIFCNARFRGDFHTTQPEEERCIKGGKIKEIRTPGS